MKMNQRGQMNAGIVWGVIIMLVSICIGGLVFGAIQKATETSAAGTGLTTGYGTLNSTFTDNTIGIPNHWENYKENGAVNAWNTSGYITVTSTENEIASIDNGVWRQSATISTGYDEISSAFANFSYLVVDNDNAQSMVIRVLLSRSADNVTLYLENVTLGKSATWVTIENDISSYITAPGTYTLYLRAEVCGRGPGVDGKGTNLVVGFDNASLTVNTYGYSIAENIVGETGAAGVSIFPLIILMVTVAVFAAIIAVLKYLG